MARRERGVLDTSVVVDIASVTEEALPTASAIAALTLAELTAGPLSTTDPSLRAERLERLQCAESRIEAIPFDTAAATLMAASTPRSLPPIKSPAVEP
jgi:predicted nucleic acid-binding protein